MVHRIIRNGEYKFSFPMVGYGNVEGDISTVEVELFIGKQTDFNQMTNADISVVVYVKDASNPIEHHIESVASDLVAFLTFYMRTPVNAESIVWYFAFPHYGDFLWKQAEMKWLPKQQRYSDGATKFNELERPLKNLVVEG